MNNKKKKDLIVGSLCALGCEALFGLSYIFTKQVTNLASPFVLMGWRFFIAFVVMSIFIVFFRIKINLKNKPLKKVFLIALCSPVIYFVGETMGISLTTGGYFSLYSCCIACCIYVYPVRKTDKKTSYWNFGNFNWSYFYSINCWDFSKFICFWILLSFDGDYFIRSLQYVY